MPAALIPQGVVDVADGHHEMAGARMSIRAIHLVPDAFHRERVLADDQRPQCAQQYRQRFLVDGAVETFYATLGPDADVVVREGQPLRFAVGWIDERLGAPLFVQM